MRSVLAVLLIGYLPGALIFRTPGPQRWRRAALPAEERVFWSVILSVLLSSIAGLGFAIAGRYTFERLLATDAVITLALLAVFRGRLRLGAAAPRPTPTALLPLAIVLAGAWLVFQVPPAEYVMGGKDPGVYMTEGIRIAQRGSLVATDAVVDTLPPVFRDLFFPKGFEDGYHSSRFMGYFLLDPDAGTVVGQFPPGFPVWVAIGYGINGLSGARFVPGLCAILGLLSVFFAGARFFGRAAAAAGAALLAVNVAEIWYGRYPSAEILLQPLVFAGLLAYTRAARDDDGFFAPVSAVAFVVGAFTHITGAMVAGAVGAAAIVDVVVRRRPLRLSFWLPLMIGTAAFLQFLSRFIPPYFNTILGFYNNLRASHLALGAVALVAAVAVLVLLRSRPVSTRERWLATGLTAVVWTLAAYAYFARTAGDALAPHDADSLRTFASIYMSPLGLAGALVGFGLATRARQDSWAFLVLIAAFSVVFFYKIRIVPEHFWAARRFLAVIVPGAVLLVGAAAFTDLRAGSQHISASFQRPGVRRARLAAGVVLLLLVGYRLVTASAPIVRHVEYAGLIPHLEQLGATFGDDDLVLFESRGASDSHVLALPLAYVYSRNVLVFARTEPSKELFREFLAWALTKYRRVFFVGGGGGGTELLSRSITVTAIRGERFQIPEYESALNAYPRGVRQKEFDLSVYEFTREPVNGAVVALDVGAADDLYVRRFHAKEKSPAGFDLRWTRDASYVSAVGVRPEHRTVTLWMGSGGRPPTAEPAGVTVYLQNQRLGEVTVGEGIQPYSFAIPPGLAATLGRSDDAAVLRIDTRTWSPARVVGGDDARELGVMLDRVEIR